MGLEFKLSSSPQKIEFPLYLCIQTSAFFLFFHSSLADQKKEEGNQLYLAKNYREALQRYNEAISKSYFSLLQLLGSIPDAYSMILINEQNPNRLFSILSDGGIGIPKFNLSSFVDKSLHCSQIQMRPFLWVYQKAIVKHPKSNCFWHF